MKLRFLNRVYAWFHGYFWLPCHVCGQHYGGHEWEIDRYMGQFDSINSRGICPDCGQKRIDEAEKYMCTDLETGVTEVRYVVPKDRD